MAEKELFIDHVPEFALERGLIRFFQEQLLLLLKQKGKLTETQYGIGLKILNGLIREKRL